MGSQARIPSSNAQSATLRASGPDTIEQGRERQYAIIRYPRLRGLETDESGQRCGNAHGATSVGAERCYRHPVRHRDGGAGGRAARNAAQGAIEWVGGRTKEAVVPQAGKGKLRHVGAAYDDRARRLQPLHDSGMFTGRRRTLQQLAAGAGRLAGEIDIVLDGNGKACQCGFSRARGAEHILRRRFPQGCFRAKFSKYARAFAVCRCGARRRCSGDIGAGEFPLRDEPVEAPNRPYAFEILIHQSHAGELGRSASSALAVPTIKARPPCSRRRAGVPGRP